MEKTNVIPIGVNTDHTDTMCNDLGFKWTDNFTLLGFSLENTMTKTDSNFKNVKENIDFVLGIKPGGRK